MKDDQLTFLVARTQLPSVTQILSETSNALSPDSGPKFSNTIFYAERQGSENTHLCLASDLSLPGSDTMNISPRLVNFDIYCELLKEEDVLNQDFQLRFINAKGKWIPIKNQMMFHAAVVYQVTQKVDMITFRSKSISKLATTSKRGLYSNILPRTTRVFFYSGNIIGPSFQFRQGSTSFPCSSTSFTEPQDLSHERNAQQGAQSPFGKI